MDKIEITKTTDKKRKYIKIKRPAQLILKCDGNKITRIRQFE